jgi:hypothetical protein
MIAVALLVEWAVLGFGLPSLIAAPPRWSRQSFLRHGTVGQRYVGPVIAEWVFLVAAGLLLKYRHESFRELGAWCLGN